MPVLFLALLFSASAEFCTAEVGSESISVDADGYSCLVGTAGALECHREDGSGFVATLELGPNECIDRAIGVGFEGDVVLLYTYGDFEASASVVMSFDHDGASKWELAIPGFNIGEPLLDGGALYVTALGFLGRLDLPVGQWRWRHEGLYLSMGFGGSFARPKRVGDLIEFVEEPWPGARERRMPLLADPETGELRVDWR